MNQKSNVIFSFLGTNLDRGFDHRRWEKWRPTISLCQQEDFVVDRIELIQQKNFKTLVKRVKEDIGQVSPETEVVDRVVTMRDPWDFQEIYELLADLCRDYPFDPDRENYFAHMTTGTHVAQICLFLMVEARFLPGKLIQTGPPRGRKAMKHPGAGVVEVIDLDLSKYDRLATRFAKEQVEARDFLRSGIATKNAAFNRLIEELEVVALRSTAPVLLTGPTGAGKSHLARRIYELRDFRTSMEGDFVEINCATLRGDTAMSTLFGHKKGAFTGAASDRPGVLRQAHKGILFLDEIGELGMDEQAMLLRALEEGTFLPVGSDTPVKSKFQLIAGTNRDLRMEAAEGGFREDLLARINLWTFELPGLKDRREDLEPNLDYELERFAEKEGEAVSFNKEARERFLKFAEDPATEWRGNFRDLNAAMVRMGTLAPRGRIQVAQVEAEVVRLEKSWDRGRQDDGVGDLIEGEIDSFDRVQLAHVVKVCRESKTLSEAGRKLFAESRKKKANPNDSDRVRKFLAKFGLSFGDL
ncbi:MAG: RNA repair transcriptional activator RtcR [Akkermansiaceae bacterium]|jgi:transcriptional regulatory protein RtcR|nr:RNA repair transcriptional activator RtcR [Akkermansiaceae bacterium]